MSHYYDSNDGTFKRIPKSPWYVLSNDTFMSGWGGAKDKTNTCVVPCQTLYEAERVCDYVRSRSDQKRIRIVEHVRPKDHVVYSMCEEWLDRARERDMGEPTWENQLRYARYLPDEELQRHALVSINNNHRCEECFTCAALTTMEQREKDDERRRKAVAERMSQ